MKALIIAAGRGSRFNGLSRSSHKALIPVLGVPLLRRIIEACGPVDEAVIVTGYRAEELERVARGILPPGLDAVFIRNPEWERANGVSVLAARDYLRGEDSFLLMMSDHLFEPELAARLRSGPPPSGGCVLAVDCRPELVRDLDDATKVRLAEDMEIVDIGKGLKEFNAVDTGVFLCTPALFEALERSLARGGESLSDGVRELCRDGFMQARDVSGLMWQDVDNPDDLAEAENKLWRKVSKPRDGVVSRLLNRKISGWITRRICFLPVRPNHVTVFNCLLAGCAAWLMATGNLLAGALLTQAFSVLDGVDGELARLKKLGSWFGGWLDNLADRICDWTLIAGAALAIPHAGGQLSEAWLFVFLGLVSNVCYWTAMDSQLVSGALRAPAIRKDPLSRLEKWFHEREMVFGLTHDSYLLILALGVALGFPRQTLTVLIILETLWWSLKLYQARNDRISSKYGEYLAAGRS